MKQNSDERLWGIHLDLKGMQFTAEYDRQWLQDLADQGINAALVEYEDVFPFSTVDVAWDRATVWSPERLANFRAAAAETGIELIPLQQCLGHLEYLFRWPRYSDATEFPGYPGTLCVTNSRGVALISGMLEEVIAAHPDSRYVHLGMDEAHHLASCPSCAARGDKMTLFCEHLELLCEIVRRHNKTPIIWSDMLEDNFDADRFASLRDQVVLMPWDYAFGARPMPRGRICSWRVSRDWLRQPQDPRAPAIGDGTPFVEDLPAAVQDRIAPWYRDGMFDSLFQVDIWTQLGFRVIGGGAVRISADYHIMPNYNHWADNLQAWCQAIARNDQLGVIATSWARGNTFCPPNFCIDLTWPSIHDFGEAAGREPPAFWPGVDQAALTLLLRQLGRCKADWSLEGRILEQLRRLRGQLTAHLYEFDSLLLMTELQAINRRVAHAIAEVDYFHANIRPTPAEWQRRLDDQAQVSADLEALAARVEAHFGQRYVGEAFGEWLTSLFGVSRRRLAAATVEASDKLARAAARYADG